MPGIVLDALAPLSDARQQDALVFTSPAGGLLNNSNFRRDAFDPAVEHLGLSPFTPLLNRIVKRTVSWVFNSARTQKDTHCSI